MALNETDGEQVASVSGGKVVLKGRFTIDLGKALPTYDAPPAIAYEAVQTSDSSKPLLALVCDPVLPLRADRVISFRGIENRMFMKPHDWGVVDWSVEGRRCPVVVVDRPGRAKVMASISTRIRPMNEDLVARYLIRPMAELMEQFAAADVVHRAIRPDNMYYADAARERMVLGDAIAVPPAITQPVVFETIESGMALPAGRGTGSISNDIYSLGVTILSLLIGNVPLADMPDEKVIIEKLTHGSYNALVGRERLSLTMMEVLRGLLNDDPKERWLVSDLMYWVNGRRQSPSPQGIPRKANRPFVFDGEEYQTTRDLANAFANNWDAAATPIKDGSLNIWLRRGFSDEELIEAVNDAETDPAGIERSDDWLVSRVCIAMDPQAPIRYGKLRATVEGLGSLVGAFLDDAEMTELFTKILREQLPAFWQRHQRRLTEVQERYVETYERARSNVDRIGVGLGIERVAYDLDANLPCRSPLLTTDYVVEPSALLPAFEAQAAAGGQVKSLVDRHIAAFLASKITRQVTSDLRDLDNQVDPHVAFIASVKILATVQDRISKKDFPALASAVAGLLDPTI